MKVQGWGFTFVKNVTSKKTSFDCAKICYLWNQRSKNRKKLSLNKSNIITVRKETDTRVF